MPDSLEKYLSKVAKDHSTPLVRRTFSLYAWFWFHTEALWIKDPEKRRPYTFMMRDWIYPHKPVFTAISLAWYAGLSILTHWMPYPALVLGCLSSLLLAHLVWGSPWQRGEQEWPAYRE
jgi:hypothetical protein